NAVQNLNGAPGRWAFVLQYLAALNTPGFAGAPDAQTTESMRGKLGNLSSDFSALFDMPNLSQFLDEFSGRIGEQIEVRHTIETATHKQTEMVPGQTDVRAYFASLAKESNADVSRAYTDYAHAFFEHRIVNRPDDLNVHGLNEIFARPLSAA